MKFALLTLCFIASTAFAGEKPSKDYDAFNLAQLGKGAALVAQKDIPVPASTKIMNLLDRDPAHFHCSMELLEASPSLRKIPQGTRIVLSGEFRYGDNLQVLTAPGERLILGVSCIVNIVGQDIHMNVKQFTENYGDQFAIELP